MQHIVNNIFSVQPADFQALALQVFAHQYEHNPVYQQWVNALHVQPSQVQRLEQIPFLPVSFFKHFEVVTGSNEPEIVFESSGTTQTSNSRHLVTDLNVYKQSFLRGFERFYGNVQDWCIIGLLPAYLERPGSSLVMMVDELIKQSEHPSSGFYLYDHVQLMHTLQQLETAGQKTLLIGVTFALLDFAEQFSFPLQHTIIMETGGMKGRRREMIRQEVHEQLERSFQATAIHSEYGMTELLSQAYSTCEGIFKPVPWMKVLVRDEDDPKNIRNEGRGVINVIDLANINSCSFIATDDLGTLHTNGSFEVLGRIDNSDIRGCSLMVV